MSAIPSLQASCARLPRGGWMRSVRSSAVPGSAALKLFDASNKLDLAGITSIKCDSGIDTSSVMFFAPPREVTIIKARMGPHFDNDFLLTCLKQTRWKPKDRF
jgi:hypothetical protein